MCKSWFSLSSSSAKSFISYQGLGSLTVGKSRRLRDSRVLIRLKLRRKVLNRENRRALGPQGSSGAAGLLQGG